MWKKLAAVYALVSTACTSWQTQRGPVPGVVEQSTAKGENLVRVDLTSGERYEIYAARVVGDSIIGRNTPTVKGQTQRIAVATADVRSISLHKFSAGRTLVAVAAITVAVVALVGAAASSGSSSSSSNSSCASA